MARKTTAAAKKAIIRWNEDRQHLIEVIRVKTTVAEENQATYIQEKSLDYWLGVAHGKMCALENFLHICNCYHGFFYVDENSNFVNFSARNTDNPNWYIAYYIEE